MTATRGVTRSVAQFDGYSTDIGLLVTRVVFGGLMAAHGSQKLFGWFDGPGWEKTAAGFEQMGYNPGKFFGTLAGLTEFFGGLGLLLGLLVPLSAAAFIGVMINAISATWSSGLFAGYETPLLFAVVGVLIAFTGAGRFSLDHGRPWQRQGLVWAGGSIALAIVAAVLTLIAKAVF